MASKVRNRDKTPPASAPDTRDAEDKYPERRKERRWPTDPWEKDFRLPAANATLDEIRDQLGPVPEEFQISDKELRRLQSKEWAERRRPYYRWMAILKERGLYEEYHQSFPLESIWEEEYSCARSFLSRSAPDLLGQFEHYWSSAIKGTRQTSAYGHDVKL
ncbi:uncharacterized protein BDW43DRAFT_228801 [Aspergillus alliaceus]|uniref:uncharacterized protein n=1 Tax=Petromyces alliaceus TaxID=209559 RepID=UPI0012A55F33|nr:uncharacterized protein BDW43DRAFT_228801 [Aspergillus alliaceus]KAB8236989.1 hypothetical protein BDW43DRAFT_228801 [Aspergillus alliaceus]